MNGHVLKPEIYRKAAELIAERGNRPTYGDAYGSLSGPLCIIGALRAASGHHPCEGGHIGHDTMQLVGLDRTFDEETGFFKGPATFSDTSDVDTVVLTLLLAAEVARDLGE